MIKQKILVAEDSPAQRLMLARQLKKWEYEVIEASDGAEGLTRFQVESPAIVITDLDMPVMDGIALIERIRALESSRTYIIVLSASGDKSTVVTALAHGADDYLVKPYHPDELHVRLSGAERVLRLQNQELLIFAMAQLVDIRSSETGAHLERVQFFCRRLAEELAGDDVSLGISASWISSLVSMSPLHDIGKIGIPDAILNKPGRLDPDEFEIMKDHVNIGVSVLSRIYERTRYAPFGFAIELIASHHEKWDGSGYPNGLSGKEIPLSGRIVALADVYDAISSQRVYKPAFPRDECRRIILEGSGSHFDPALVGIFDRIEDELWSVVERLRDSHD
ncbi:MAG: response regulator [Synergistaceae bacterium]|nr:response regulator [Synergistota bacterium]NLM72189.1 response regulator [Synergistaceae bacterium]